MVVGLTGYYCSGKSTVDNILSNDFNFKVIDIDKLGHIVLEESKEKLLSVFGESIISGDGRINRKELGSIVFSDKSKLLMLNQITHPIIIKKAKEEITFNKPAHSVISAALLYEMGLNEFCDKVFIVKSHIYKIIYRGLKRDKRTIKQIISILKNQKLKHYLNEKKNSDDIYIINNNGSRKQLFKKVNDILSKENNN